MQNQFKRKLLGVNGKKHASLNCGIKCLKIWQMPLLAVHKYGKLVAFVKLFPALKAAVGHYGPYHFLNVQFSS